MMVDCLVALWILELYGIIAVGICSVCIAILLLVDFVFSIYFGRKIVMSIYRALKSD